MNTITFTSSFLFAAFCVFNPAWSAETIRHEFNGTALSDHLIVEDPDKDDTISLTDTGRLRVKLNGVEDAWLRNRGGAPFLLDKRSSEKFRAAETFVNLAAGGEATPNSIGGIILTDAGNDAAHPFEVSLGLEKKKNDVQVVLQKPGSTLALRKVEKPAAFLKLQRNGPFGLWQAFFKASPSDAWTLIHMFNDTDLPGGGIAGDARAGLFAKTWDGTASAVIEFDYLTMHIGEANGLAGKAYKQGFAYGPKVDLESLLGEMINREQLALFPEPAHGYICNQASSYQRDSKSPDKPGWFANNDWSHFIRPEKKDNRVEWVMMDAGGPGCITRIWMGGVPPYGKLRFYLDGADTPVITEQVEDLMGSDALVGPPFSAIRARGRNLYLPIPYAKHCKVTYDGRNFWETRGRDDRTWYIINYRTYTDQNLKVKTFSMDQHRDAASLIKQTGEILLNRGGHPGRITDKQFKQRSLGAGETLDVSFQGTMAVRKLSVRVLASNIKEALNKTILHIACDGQKTATVPVGHFFGSGVGFHPFKDWYREIKPDGTLTCYWVMPFQRDIKVTLENKTPGKILADLDVQTGPWHWNDRSMHFHARKREADIAIKARQGVDWNFITLSGKGVLVGDTLSIHNGAATWWGEGDEKIWVDNENFPSHFGTGTEDYYGYSYGNPAFFEAPFHAQPTGAGNSSVAYSTNTRTRSLDAIPFHRALKFDMEVWHWGTCDMRYEATTYFYLLPERKDKEE